MSQPSLSRRQFLQASAVVAVSMTTANVLAACAPATAPTSAPTTGDAASAPAADSAAAPSESLLRAAFGSQRDDLSVFHGVGRVNADTNRRIFSSLTQFDSNLDLIGDLAENWSVSDDRLTYTFTLRPGIVWHDGAPFTSQDVAFTILSHTHPAVAGFYANAFDKVVGIEEYRNEASDTISGMTTPDDQTIVFELTQPFSVFPSNLATIWIFPHHLLGEVAPEDLRLDPFWSTLPIGTGPYKLVNYVPKQTLEYAANENYHFGAPKIERMIWTQIPEAATQLLALESGEIDYCQMSLTRDDFDRVNENDDLYIMEAFEPRLPQMAMHYRNFDDLRVRQAICAAVDRSALLAAAGGEGYATLLEYYFMNPWASEGAIKWSDVHS